MRTPNEVYQKAELFKRLWEQRYPGETFALIGMVFKWAKELVDIDNDLICERFKIFSEDEWYAENTRHSLPAFIKNFNSFVKKTRRKDGTWKREEIQPVKNVVDALTSFSDKFATVKQQTDPNEKFRCTKCREIHSPNAECKQ